MLAFVENSLSSCIYLKLNPIRLGQKHVDYGIQIAFVTPVSFGCRGEVLAKVKISLTHLNLDQPWHGNSLLPLAPQHFKLTDLFPDGSGLDQSVAGCFTTFALNNYSLLGHAGPEICADTHAHREAWHHHSTGSEFA